MTDVSSPFRKTFCSAVLTFLLSPDSFPRSHTLQYLPFPAFHLASQFGFALSNLFAHCHLIISCRISPSVSTRSSRSTDFYLHFLLLFIFPLPWTLSSLFPKVQAVTYKAVAVSLTSFSTSISILEIS